MNIILMDIYDEYNNGNSISKLENFAKITFNNEKTGKIFIGFVLILINNVYRTRINAESLISVVNSANVVIGESNLLRFYLDRVNGDKMVSKYLGKYVNDDDFLVHIDSIIKYLKMMSFDFCESIKRRYNDKIFEYNNGIYK